jgi:hypothetical protein
MKIVLWLIFLSLLTQNNCSGIIRIRKKQAKLKAERGVSLEDCGNI